MDQQTIDNLTATRIIHLLITPYKEWVAFKAGIIDKNGKQIGKVDFSNVSNFNLLHKLVIRLRELYHITPGSNKIVQAWNAGSYFLDKDMSAGNFTNWSISNKHLLPSVVAAYNVVKESSKFNFSVKLTDKQLLELVDLVTTNDILMMEDGVVGTSIGGGGVAGINPGEVIVPTSASEKYKKGNAKATKTTRKVMKP